MVSAITEGVKVGVQTQYQPKYSSPIQYHYVFIYAVTIENNSAFTLQLLRRHWYIYDVNAKVKEIEGEGVVGQQPILESGARHEYVSGCNLKTGFGKMEGTYLVERIIDNRQFEVIIPTFSLIVPFKLN